MQCFITPQGGAKPAESCWTASVLWGSKWSPILSAHWLQLLEQSRTPQVRWAGDSTVHHWHREDPETIDKRLHEDRKQNNICCLWTPKPVITWTREREVKVNNQESINDQRKIKEAIYTCRQRVCGQRLWSSPHTWPPIGTGRNFQWTFKSVARKHYWSIHPFNPHQLCAPLIYDYPQNYLRGQQSDRRQKCTDHKMIFIYAPFKGGKKLHLFNES